MPNKLITALKENKNDIRRKVGIVVGVVVATVVAGVVVHKITAAQQEPDVYILEVEAEPTEADSTI
jgi:hypothetical protein